MEDKNDYYFLEQALREIEAIILYTKGLKYEEFINDIKTIDATMFRLQQMIEKIKHLSIDYREKHKEIPWGQIFGFRNGIVHEYGKVNYQTVYEIISTDIYNLKEIFISSLVGKKECT